MSKQVTTMTGMWAVNQGVPPGSHLPEQWSDVIPDSTASSVLACMNSGLKSEYDYAAQLSWTKSAA